MKIQLKRSNQLDGGNAKAPTAAQMEYGELAVNYVDSDPAIFLKDSNDAIVRIAGAGSSGVGDGSLTITTAGEGASATGTFTANQTGNSTLVLPTIRYQDISGTPTIPTVNDGALTIQTAGEGASSTGTFTANQSGASTLTLPAIRYQDISGTPTIPAAAGNGALTIQTHGENASATGTFTANQTAGSTITLPQIRYQDISGTPAAVTPGDGALTIQTAGEGASATGTFTANQSGGSTLTLPTIRYQDISGALTATDYVAVAGDNMTGALTIGPEGGTAVTTLDDDGSAEFAGQKLKIDDRGTITRPGSGGDYCSFGAFNNSGTTIWISWWQTCTKN